MNRVGLVAALTATKHFEHIRPDGNATNTAQRNGYIERLENLDLSSANTSLYDFIVNSWADSEERGIIAAHNGDWAQGGGHYFVLIPPPETHGLCLRQGAHSGRALRIRLCNSSSRERHHDRHDP